MDVGNDIVIVGAGPGGLTLALRLAAAGIHVRVFEAVPSFKPVGVGINLLPHATKVLSEIGLEDALAARAVATRESAFFNRFGQLIHREPAGKFAGYRFPQFSIHRADLQDVLVEAFRARIGSDRLVMGARCMGFEQDEGGVTLRFTDAVSGAPLPAVRAGIVVACDGLHSAIRKQLHPNEGPPRYSGVNMWRGVTRWKPFLTGASMVRAGWLACGKMVIYPIRNAIDAKGRQLVNWVAEIETPKHLERDWNRPGNLDDFIGPFADWRFDWLDVPAMIRAADMTFEFPMIDQDPLPRWTFGRVTLLGDAAHPMVPRGSNGAVQAVIDAEVLAGLLAKGGDLRAALGAYETVRREATTQVVLTNRKNPPDAILREVYERSGDKPFRSIDDVMSKADIEAISSGYKAVSGYQRAN